MFTEGKSTVFILGAGASWHYGFPTGEVLVKEIRKKAENLSRYYEHSWRSGNRELPKFLGNQNQFQWKSAWEQCARLHMGLQQANPLVVDYFLGLNPDFQEVGKLLIAWVLLERYSRSSGGSVNINRDQPSDDDWCRFVTHQLTVGCSKSADLLRNKISFVTFNYDLSLEHRLASALRHVQLFEPEDIKTFLGGNRIIHVYGKLADLDLSSTVSWSVEKEHPQKSNQSRLLEYEGNFTQLLNAVHDASVGLRVIDPHNKGADAENIQLAKMQIAHAKRLFILGYGFDENNNERLSLSETIRGSRKHVFFTNYDNNRNINKRVSRLLMGNETHFRSESDWSVESYERSTRNVYDALSRDFDL
jgi:hypothetical protein